MTKHAELSASGASRWVACPGSREAEKGLPNSSNAAAREGTVIHFLSEQHLRRDENFADLSLHVGRFYEADGQMVEVTDEMVELANAYIGWVETNILNNEKIDLIHHELEQRVNFETWVPQGFGTADLIAVYDEHWVDENDEEHQRTVLHVADLKTGRGEVIAEENLQGLLYALGAYDNLMWLQDSYDLVRITIYAPRQSGEDTWELDLAGLLERGKTIAAAAQEAYKPNAKRVAGPQCDYCLARPTCVVAAQHALNTAQLDFDDEFDEVAKTEISYPTDLTLDQVAKILPHLDTMEKWIATVRDYAYAQAMNGQKLTGFKLIQGRAGSRRWASDETSEQALLDLGLSMDDIYEEKMISPTQAEKLIGKDKALKLLEDGVIEQPQTKPKLVPQAAKGTEYVPDPASDFDDE